MTEVRVIGAGLSGLATAWYLTEAGACVHVIEATSRAGGLIQTHRMPEGLVETAANAFTSSPRVLALFSGAGVEACVPKPAATRRYIFRGGRPRRWPLSPIETSATVLRAGAAWISRRHRPDGAESLAAWGRRTLGRAAVEWVVAPAAQGIYAAPADALSAVAVLGGRRRGGILISPRRGMQELVDGLVETLRARGVRFSFGERAAAVDPTLPTAICTDAPSAALLLGSHAARLADALGRIRRVSLISATAFFQPSPDDLSGFGVLFPRTSKVGALGVLFNTDIFSDRGDLRSETWIYGESSGAVAAGRLDEEDLRRRLDADRAVLTGRAERPVAVYMTPHPNALPLYDAAVLGAAAAIQELPPTLALVGNWLGSIGLSRLVEAGAAAAARLLRVDSVKS